MRQAIWLLLWTVVVEFVVAPIGGRVFNRYVPEDAEIRDLIPELSFYHWGYATVFALGAVVGIAIYRWRSKKQVLGIPEDGRIAKGVLDSYVGADDSQIGIHLQAAGLIGLKADAPEPYLHLDFRALNASPYNLRATDVDGPILCEGHSFSLHARIVEGRNKLRSGITEIIEIRQYLTSEAVERFRNKPSKPVNTGQFGVVFSYSDRNGGPKTIRLGFPANYFNLWT